MPKRAFGATVLERMTGSSPQNEAMCKAEQQAKNDE